MKGGLGLIQLIVPGHGLMFEGAAFDNHGRRINGGISGYGAAYCSCGERSPDLENGAQRKRWHRDHKNTVWMRQQGVTS